MNITFTGNPRDPKDRRESVTIGGITFPLHVCVTTEDTPPFSGLRGNDHFAVTDDNDAPDVTAPVADVKQAGDTITKTDLIALAEQRGVKIDGRWSAERIAKAIEAAS